MVKVLFVCLGNICRSPTAQGALEKILQEQDLADYVRVDSAGTHAYHVGEPPDPRAQSSARSRGMNLARQQARRVAAQDFLEYDYILAMDYSNFENLKAMCPPEQHDKIRLFMEYAPHLGYEEVPDPYYGGSAGFERVLDLVEEAARGLIEHIRVEHREKLHPQQVGID